MDRFWVVLGPPASARRFANRRGWDPGCCAVISTAEQLRLLDPLAIAGVQLVDMAHLDPAERDAVALEMCILRTVWPEIRIVSAVDVAGQVDAGRVPVLC